MAWLGPVALGPVALLAPGCGSDTPAEVPVDQLPPYTAEQAALYNDALAPQIFGIESLAAPEKKLKIGDLVEHADTVARTKLITVTRTRTPSDGRVRYLLVVQPLGEPLAGQPLPASLELTVGLGSPSLSLLRTMDTEVVGSKFILFLKRYRAHGQSTLHFRAEVDSAELADTIQKLD
jgi:hypothetical protein